MPTCAARILAVSLAFGVAACALPGRLPAPAEGGPGSPVAVTRAFYAALHAGDAPRAAALVGSPNAARATQAFVALAQAYEAVERAPKGWVTPRAWRRSGRRWPGPTPRWRATAPR
jgi:hypothetical protein